MFSLDFPCLKTTQAEGSLQSTGSKVKVLQKITSLFITKKQEFI